MSPIMSHGGGEKGELEEWGGVLGRLLSPGHSGSEPEFFISSQSLITWWFVGGEGGY